MKKKINIKKEIQELYKKLNIDTKKAEQNLKNNKYFTFNNDFGFSLSNTAIKKKTQ